MGEQRLDSLCKVDVDEVSPLLNNPAFAVPAFFRGQTKRSLIVSAS